jgi:hypothetical protein
MSTTKNDELADRYAGWAATLGRARERAAAALDGEPTEEQLCAAVRELADAEDSIPAPVRAMEIAMHDAAALVRGLTERGVVFANPDNAPAQIAAAIYAGWLDCFRGSNTRPVDWLFPVAHMVEAVAYAIDHPEGTGELTRETVSRLTGNT